MSSCAIAFSSLVLIVACASEPGEHSSSQLTIASAVAMNGTVVARPNPVGATFRIDFDVEGEEITALIAGHFGDPAVFVGVRTEDRIVLESSEPNTFASGPLEVGSIGLTRVSLDVRAAVGEIELTGSGTYEGYVAHFEDGLGYVQGVQGEFSTGRDEVPPELRFIGGGTRRRPLLPWSGFDLKVSEPVDSMEIERVVEAPEGGTVSAVPDAFGFSHVVNVTPIGWWPRSSTEVEINVIPGALDPSGNIDVVGFDGRVAQVRETTPVERLDFDSSASDFERWGPPATLPRDTACASGTGCESFDLANAVFFGSGLFAQLGRAEPFVEVAARFRFLAPPDETLTVRIRVASPGNAPQETTLETTTDASGDTGWVDLSLALEAPLSEAVVVVDFSPRSFRCESCVGVLDDVRVR